MSLVVVGSVALDDIETPTATRENVLGGSAVFFSYTASYFTPVSLVAVVGEDWPQQHTELLQSRRIDTQGLQIQEGGKTFRWRGKYRPNMNDRDTLEVHLNVLETFQPQVPAAAQSSPFVFLANIAPQTQLDVLKQMPQAKFKVADTMDLWISLQHDQLMELLKQIDGLVLNDSEAMMLADDENLIRAGHKVREMGPKFVIVKKGEHGAIFFSARETYVLPAYPTEQVIDPTGAGDSFAGGMMGYLAEQKELTPEILKRAMAYGIVTASFTVEDFSLDRLKDLDRSGLEQRFEEYKSMLLF